jgi:hypothetical protein
MAGRSRNRALFAQLDADKNGQLSPAEFAGHRNTGACRQRAAHDCPHGR